MTGDFSLLSNISQSTSQSLFTIANGSKSQVKGIGTIMTPNLTLSSVLYIPQFLSSLLSVRLRLTAK